MDQKFTGKDIARLAYMAAIEEIAEIQQRMALRAMVIQQHSDNALPIRPFMRRIDSRQQTLARAADHTAQEEQSDQVRLAKLYAIVKSLEATFKSMHEADDEAWAEGIAAYFRQQTRKGD